MPIQNHVVRRENEKDTPHTGNGGEGDRGRVYVFAQYIYTHNRDTMHTQK